MMIASTNYTPMPDHGAVVNQASAALRHDAADRASPGTGTARGTGA